MEHEKAVKKIEETQKKAKQLEELKVKNDEDFINVRQRSLASFQ